MNDASARLYLVTPPRFEPARLAAQLEDALAGGGIACVRLEAPGAGEDEIRRAAEALRPVCHAGDVALVLAQHFRLVGPLGLDGVHVTAGASLRDARAAIGKDAILGVHCGVSRHSGMVAAEAGADYVAFGPVAAAGALGDGALAPMELFEWWGEMIETPVVAEGGIDPALAKSLAAHADFVVPHMAIWDDERPSRALKAFL